MADPIPTTAAIETPEVSKIIVDNPKQADAKTPEQIELEKKMEGYGPLINDENPTWYAVKGIKRSTTPGKERFRPVNLFIQVDGKMGSKDFGKEVPMFSIQRKNPEGAFFRKCADFIEQFETADPPPSPKK